MKKFVSGLIVGVLLFAGASAFADSSSLIGQKVQGLFSIERNGTKVADAVVINGSTYAPVRAIAEATGSKLTVEGKKIIMAERSDAAPAVGETTQVEPVALEAEREKLKAEIEKKTKGIEEFQKSQIDFWDVLIAENPNSTTIPQWKAAKEKYSVMLEQLKTELATLQTKLTEIDAKLAASSK
ncbi:hypothetical protein NSS79_10755 [Paenibacillus sp. FSL L8-0436]|uniref:hypothetical protein n=1 Tax=Paenibacillus sp. FSL L8-0436 TaxID=2954686 RepID=UPI0031590A50